jgi:glucokinase
MSFFSLRREILSSMSEVRGFIKLEEAQRPFFAGIDLGGTNIKVGIVDDLGRPLSWLTVPTKVERGAEDAAERMGVAVHDAIAKAGLQATDIARVGLGSPGEMDLPSGMLLKPINLTGWNYFPIRDRVQHHCQLPLTFENDANAAAYGEFWIGSGREFQSMILLTLGTGIGCGIILGDTVVRGAHSHGGESGHIVFDPTEKGRLCNCGQTGHFEPYTSATGVIRRTQEALDAGRVSSISDRLAEGQELTPKLVAIEAEKGDTLSLELIADTAQYLGLGIVSLAHMIGPEVFLLGGAMTFGGKKTPLGQHFLTQVQAAVRRFATAKLAARTAIDFATLGGDAGYIGAAGVARLDYQKELHQKQPH